MRRGACGVISATGSQQKRRGEPRDQSLTHAELFSQMKWAVKVNSHLPTVIGFGKPELVLLQGPIGLTGYIENLSQLNVAPDLSPARISIPL